MFMANRLHYLVPICLTSCMSSGPTTLTVTGSGFSSDDEGKVVKVAVVDVNGNKIVTTGNGAVSGGKFTFDLTVGHDTKYRLDVFTDLDGDGKCQYGVDHVYAVDISGIGEGTAYSATILPSAFDSRGCLAWGGGSLHVTLSNFTSSGAVYKAALFKSGLATRLGLKTGAVQGGTLDFTLEGAIIPGTFYRVDLFIDNNSDDKCQAGDLIVSKPTGALPPPQVDGLSGDVVQLAMDGTHDLAAASICTTSFP